MEGVLRFIEENREEQFAFLKKLISFRSVTGQEGGAQDFMAHTMREVGLETTIQEPDLDILARRNPSFSHVERGEGRKNVIGTFGRGKGKTLILNGHIDVVEAGEGWGHHPWEGTMEDESIYGRGACDMKGGISCMLYALHALVNSGLTLEGRVVFQSVIGEEEGGTGTLAALQEWKGDAAIIPEPTRLSIATAQEGALTFHLTVPGRAAHACARREGVSALEKFEKVHRAIRLFEARRNRRLRHPLYKTPLPFPMLVGKVSAGNWDSTVPDRLTAEGRYGISPREDIEKARKQFERMIDEACRKDPWLAQHPVQVQWKGSQFDPAEISSKEPIVTTLSRSFSSIAKRKSILEGMTYGADMRLFVKQGIPCVMFGPGDVRRAHFPDEYVPCDELILATKVLAKTIVDFCGAH